MQRPDDQKILSDIRREIDGIDDQLLVLLNQRARCAKTVADIKMAAGEAECFHRPEREVEVLRRMMESNPGPLSKETIARFFREVMSECLALEKPLDVGFLGPEGTFTQQAAYRHFGHAIHAVPYASIDAIFRAVESGSIVYGVVPVENSTEGVIANTLDSFLQHPLLIAGEVSLRIHHNLLSKTSDLSQIREIYSHHQSLAQCRHWLDRTLPSVPRIAVASNAEAARMASQNPGTAAIAGEVAASLYGLSTLAPMIEDESNNTTRFLVVGRVPVGPTGHDKTSLLLTIPNDPGALYAILEPFARHGISMSKIESRPSRKDVWDYVFFIDVEGHCNEPKVSAALEEVASRTTLLKILGSYPKSLNCI